MDIHLEKNESNSIQAYDDTHIKINQVDYDQNIIVSHHDIISDWSIEKKSELTLKALHSLIQLKPEVIIIGHSQKQLTIASNALEALSLQRIGIECMSIGAACRTFNVLLNEKRVVVLGVIF